MTTVTDKQLKYAFDLIKRTATRVDQNDWEATKDLLTLDDIVSLMAKRLDEQRNEIGQLKLDLANGQARQKRA